MGAQQVGAFVVGGLLMLVAYGAYNLGTTGEVLTNGYQAGSDLTERVGFSGAHTLAIGLQNQETQMKLLLLVLHGWPRYVGLMFVLLPFMLFTRNRWDWFLLGSAASVMGVWVVFDGTGIMHGPRYWYEAVPFLMLLSARGADRAAELLADAAGLLRRTFFGSDQRPLWAGILVVYALVFALIGSSVHGWLLGERQDWDATFVPERAESLRGLFGVDDRLVVLVDEAQLENALVLVENCGLGTGWNCYGSVAWLNSPMLDGDVVFARDLKDRRDEILRAFPGRDVYIATFTTPSIVPYEPAQSDGEPQPEGAVQ